MRNLKNFYMQRKIFENSKNKGAWALVNKPSKTNGAFFSFQISNSQHIQTKC